MAHQLTFVGILQPVQEHVIEHALVPHPKTAARLVEQIRGAAHALHPAGDHHVCVTESQPIGRQHHRLHAGTAHLVDRGAGDAVRQARLQYRLTGGRLADPGTQHVAKISLIDLLPLEPGLCHGCGDGTSTQFGCALVGQGPLKGPHGGTFGRNNHDIHQLHSPCYIELTYAAAVAGTRLAGQLTFG